MDAPLGNCPDCLVGLGLAPQSLPASETAPSRFGDYELIELIGRGGMGVVYKARQLSLNRIIALKMLNPHSAAFPLVAERLRLEAETAASLHHPNIVTIHEVGECDGRPFFTMNLVEGTGMDRLISKAGFRLPNLAPAPRHREGGRSREQHGPTVRTLITIAHAVDYAHKHGVLHRDLKPANVVVDAAGTPHLTDFGIAKILGRERTRQTDTGFLLGTPAYMAPEQAAGGTCRVSTSGDIYSLGAVLYEMITGLPPFRGETPWETLRQVVNDEPKSPSAVNETVDSDLATICLKCLEKKTERRYSTAQALAEDLERWLRHEPIEARPVGAAGRLWRWCHREPRLAAMAAGLFILMTATTILVWTLYYRESKQLRVAIEEKARQKDVLFGRIDKEWVMGGRNGVRVYASELAVLAERPLMIESDEIEVVLGVHQPRQAPDPLQILQRFELLVNSPRSREPVQGGGRLLFELQLYPTYSNALAGLTGKEAHVMLLTPITCVQHRLLDPDLRPLAQFLAAGKRTVPIVIFAPRDSPIRTLADLKGKVLGFGVHDMPLMEDAVKAALWSAGLRRKDLHKVISLPHGSAIGAVRARGCDVGVTTLNEFSRHTKAGASLQIIHQLDAPNYVWAGTGRPLKHRQAALDAIQQWLISIRDPDALAAQDESLTGFAPVSARDFDDWESILKKARRFDGIE